MLATIFTILASLVPTILQNAGILGSKTSTLITNLLGPVETLIANLRSGNSGIQDGLAALGAFSGVVAVLKSETGLPADVLTSLNNIDADIQKALSNYVTAEGGYNATLYTQIAPVA